MKAAQICYITGLAILLSTILGLLFMLGVLLSGQAKDVSAIANVLTYLGGSGSALILIVGPILGRGSGYTVGEQIDRAIDTMIFW